MFFLVLFFYIFSFGCFGRIKDKEILRIFFKSLIIVTSLSVRINSDGVEEVFLNCPKYNGRI